MDTGGRSWVMDIREQFLVVSLHVWTPVGVAGVEDLRERFLVVTLYLWTLVGVTRWGI